MEGGGESRGAWFWLYSHISKNPIASKPMARKKGTLKKRITSDLI